MSKRTYTCCWYSIPAPDNAPTHMISIICVYNSTSTLQSCLLNSLSKQKTDFELISVDNTEKRFKSAAEALNWGGKQAAGDYLIFAHQDVDLRSDSWLNTTETLLKSLPNLGIAGVAGVIDGGISLRERYTDTITQRPPKKFKSGITHGPRMEPWGTPIEGAEPVQTLDECLVIIPKSVFGILQFDEATCSDWHLYAVDYCLSVATQGFGVYAIPSCLHHRSKGLELENRFRVIASLRLYPEAYYSTLGHVLRKHKNRYKWIYTSCGSWSTTYPLTMQRAAHVLRYFAGSLVILLFNRFHTS